MGRERRRPVGRSVTRRRGRAEKCQRRIPVHPRFVAIQGFAALVLDTQQGGKGCLPKSLDQEPGVIALVRWIRQSNIVGAGGKPINESQRISPVHLHPILHVQSRHVGSQCIQRLARHFHKIHRARPAR